MWVWSKIKANIKKIKDNKNIQPHKKFYKMEFKDEEEERLWHQCKIMPLNFPFNKEDLKEIYSQKNKNEIWY